MPLRQHAAVRLGRSYMRSPSSFVNDTMLAPADDNPNTLAMAVSDAKRVADAHIISASLFSGNAVVFAPPPIASCNLKTLAPQRERHLRISQSEGAILSRSKVLPPARPQQLSHVETTPSGTGLIPTSWYPLARGPIRTGWSSSPRPTSRVLAPGLVHVRTSPPGMAALQQLPGQPRTHVAVAEVIGQRPRSSIEPRPSRLEPTRRDWRHNGPDLCIAAIEAA